MFRCGNEECPRAYTSLCVTRMIKGKKIRLVGYDGNHGRKGKYTQFLCGGIRGRKQLGNLRIDERIILTQTLKKQNGTALTGSSCSGLGQLSCSYKRRCNYLGCIKFGEFLKWKKIC